MKEPLSQSTPEALDLREKSKVSRPIGVELFFAGQQTDSDIHEGIFNNPLLIEQAAERRRLHTLVERFFNAVPDPKIDIKEAQEQGLITEAKVDELYENLADFIEGDENNVRLLLYLPFEILPDLTDSNKDNVSDSSRRLADIYREGWIRLLHEIEPRASFVDGDILEPGLPEPEQISKAGHLIPEILGKGIISTRDVLNLIDIIDNPQIIKSMAEGATVARDKGLINDADWQIIQELFSNKLKGIPLGRIEYDEASFENVSPQRTAWLKRVEAEKTTPAKRPQEMALDLSTPQPVKTETIESDFAWLIPALEKIQQDLLLSKSLYPTFLVFGSRIKGYARENSDYDAALFFKPNVAPQDRANILNRLFKVAPEMKIVDNLLEYWVDEDEGKLDFRQMDDNPKSIGFPQVHFFMGGVWLSQGSDDERISRDVLEQYLDLSQYDEEKEAIRASLLARIELDVLQYRLMHGGFRQFYPSNKAQGAENSHLIDSQSDFWDPGYRRVATKLFLSRVFLPDLS